MEATCTRCHQPILAENCYCPACGLPQLLYATDALLGQATPEPWDEAVRDAASVDWKAGLRASLLLAIPAGLLSSGLSPVAFFGLFWMAAAASWAVVLYVRGQRAHWITAGAGARIGLVTGLLAAWLAFALSGSALFVERYLFHQSSQIDSEWQTRVSFGQQMAEQFTAGLAPPDAAQAQAARAQFQAWMLSPEGHAGMEAFRFAFDGCVLLFFAVIGGALAARLLARTRRPEL